MIRLASSILLAAMVAPVPPVGLAAQSPSLVPLRQQLAAVTDRDSLRARERATIEIAKVRRDDAMPHLELGFIAMRLGEVTDVARHYEDALDEFAMAVELQPAWWVGWYGQALAELGLLRTELGLISRIKTMTGRDPQRLAALRLAQSAALDSLHAEGLVEFARHALHTRDATDLAVATEALRQALVGPAGELRAVRFAYAVLEREQDRYDAAIAVLVPLVARDSTDSEARLELAGSRFDAGRLDGMADWYRALEEADSALLERFRRDLVLVMPDSTLIAVLGAAGAERARLARRFWDSQVRVGLPVTAERLRDHYMWLRLARRFYRRQDPSSVAAMVPGMREGSEEFDARGVVTVLHGPPKHRTVLNLPGVMRNESWAYYNRLAGDTLLFHFIAPPGREDYVLVESVLDIFRLSGQARFMTASTDTTADGRPVIGSYGASLTAQTSQELFVSRERLSPLYTRMFDEGKRGAAELQQVERDLGARSIAAGSSWEFGFELPLAAQIDAVAIGDRPGVVQLAYALSGGAVTPTMTVLGAYYRVRLRAAVRDAAGDVVATVDTTRVVRRNGVLLPTETLLDRVALTLPPGEYTVQMSLNAEEKGTIFPALPLVVTAPVPNRLVVSDLVLGSRRMPLPVPTARGDTAWVNPTRRFAKSAPMQFYVEVDGLEAGARYDVELAIVRPGSTPSRDRTALKVSFGATHPGGVAVVERDLDLGRLDPGEYRLDMTVTTPEGGRAVRRRQFTVVR